ncbi:uncharacterized protein LOC123292537 [Chrysoperla carnea]|uniref:uncharacterized protein LOC123292537 n=1 Tax=Chrysoperla carnea TaxID=189513 RepID=UPI001D096798|nr:uncharacterized protein LOC123292537 [Chrysoperla carnea]
MAILLHYCAIFCGVFLITFKGCYSEFIKENVTLIIDQGTLVGRKSLDYWNGTFYNFEGIPFAKPPIGELRFKAPEPAEPWFGIYDATKARPICPQIEFPYIKGMEQNEDCLFLSIHSKMSKKLQPVMVWFFGGGFQYGTIFGHRYGPEFLISQDIVLVKVSYRLNTFGFLMIDDPKYGIPGNAGFKDQVLALKWIQKNIHNFGGDPNQVTIFGQSAGGTSVNLLSLSPLAKGLFHRAIMQSGTAGASYLTTPKKFTAISSSINCTANQTLDDIVKCINESTTESLINGLEVLDGEMFYNEILNISVPDDFNILTIEKHCTNSFLEERPGCIISKENFEPIPTIMGFTTNEINEDDARNYFFSPNFTDYRILIPSDIKIDLKSDEAFELGKRIKEVYYGNQTPSNELVDQFVKYLMDTNGLAKMYKYAKILSKSTSVYFYEFNYYTKLNPQQNTTRKNINHSDDLSYLFYMKGTTPENMGKISEEYIAIHRMIKLWTTFAKTGNPNPENDPLLNVKWLPIESSKFNYLKISQKLKLKQNLAEKRMKFWEQVYKQYDSIVEASYRYKKLKSPNHGGHMKNIFLGTVFLITQKFDLKNVTVTIDQGTILGKKSLDYWNETFYSFEGIPYAKPPIGELRFKEPEQAEPWTDIYDATKQRPACSQIGDFLIAGVEQNEDCLFLNIYSKMARELKPVMVFIHGGGLGYGSIFEARYGPELLMTEDIVLVKIAYRLNVFGFGVLDDPKYGIHGNMGFKDQVLALKWIQKNINHFGGDPKQVTIFGESAGGSSVSFLGLSPLAEGLFHRAIMQSGVAANFPITIKLIDLAEPLKCSSDKLDKIVDCINKKSTRMLLNGLNELQQKKCFNKVLKIPEKCSFNSFTIEKNSSNCFLTDKPENIIKNGKFNAVPVVIGFNTDEGYNLVKYYDVKPNFTDYRVLIPKDIKIDLASNRAVDLGKRIKELYYGSQTPSNELFDPFSAYLTDLIFMKKIYKFAKYHSLASQTTPVYFYEFNYYTKLNPQQNTPRKYIKHGDDIPYLFYKKRDTPENMDRNSEEYIALYRMLKLWTTFAKTGDPNPVNDPLLNVKWLPIESNKFNYLKLSQNLELKENPLENRMKFWDEIYTEFKNHSKTVYFR